MTGGTEVERREGTRAGRMDMAAAKLANSVGSLMGRAARASGKRSSQIAKDMHVTPGRVTQILSAGGNVRIATLARFMDACGYELKVTAEPKEAGLPRLELPTRGRRPLQGAGVKSVARRQCDVVDAIFGGADVLPGGVLYAGEFEELRPTASSIGNNLTYRFLVSGHWLTPEGHDSPFAPPQTVPTTDLYEQGLRR